MQSEELRTVLVAKIISGEMFAVLSPEHAYLEEISVVVGTNGIPLPLVLKLLNVNTDFLDAFLVYKTMYIKNEFFWRNVALALMSDVEVIWEGDTADDFLSQKVLAIYRPGRKVPEHLFDLSPMRWTLGSASKSEPKFNS